MVRTAWQDLKLNDVKLKGVGGQQFLADLVLADPVQYQPKLSEQTIARKLFDLISYYVYYCRSPGVDVFALGPHLSVTLKR